MTYEIITNPTFNSLEVYFEGKPGEAIRAALKTLKFRWNNKKMCWYGFADREEVVRACEGAKVETAAPATKTDKDEQKKLFAEYMDIIKKEVWQDEKMQEYARKSTAYIVELTNGDIIALDKPRIETSFCFGHGYCGRTTEEDEKRAYNMAEYAATNQDYFIKENIKGLEEKIKDLRDTRLKAYTYTAYSGQPEKSKLKNYTLASLCYTPEYNPAYYANLKDLKEITTEDRKRIAAGLEKVKADFVKRLNTYLKKYGLTKVRTWTYLSD